jgi:hypothetical protein
MAEMSKVFKGVSFTDSLKNYLAIRNVSLCQFLLFLDIADIAQHIENNLYGDKDWHFRYDVSAMIKFAIVKFFRQQPFKKIVLSEEDTFNKLMERLKGDRKGSSCWHLFFRHSRNHMPHIIVPLKSLFFA